MNISKNNFVTIQGWMAMPKEEGGLALAGAELIAYALLYGFSQDDKSWYQGTQEYLADWCGCTTRNIRNILKSLLDKGYIEKREKRVRNITMYDYRTTDVSNFHPEEKFSGVQEKSSAHNYKNNYTTPSDISSNEDISSPPKGKRQKQESSCCQCGSVSSSNVDSFQLPHFSSHHVQAAVMRNRRLRFCRRI